MDKFSRSGLILAAGLLLLAFAGAIHAILLEGVVWTYLAGIAGTGLLAWGAWGLRDELAALVRRRRGEIVLYAAGLLGVMAALAYLSTQFTARIDMTEEARYSLMPQTLAMLKKLDKPVRVTFFHDPQMRESVELYELMAAQTGKISLELFDPMLNPAQARLRSVQFAGTTILESENRKLLLSNQTEIEIANAIMRVSQGVTQKVCFLDGHQEPDPFSQETHDHMEGAAGHSHGLGMQYVTHQQHGMAKARGALETLNYTAEKISLARESAAESLKSCSLLIVAGPKVALLAQEVSAIDRFLAAGGNAFFMLDPFVTTGLEPVIREYSIVADQDLVVDESSHFWADPSSPAVTDYNYHVITQELPLTFFPGARSFSPADQQVPGTNVQPLVNSSQQSFGVTDPKRARFDKGVDLPGPLTIMVVALRRPVDLKDELYAKNRGNAAASATKAGAAVPVTEKSRIAVIGDSDFATNSFFHVMGNGRLFLNTVNYLASKENLIGLEPRARDVPRVNLTNRQMKGTFFVAIILIPALLAAIGFAVWWKQR